MENKLNIAELLRDCPKGMELYSTIYGTVYFNGVRDTGYAVLIDIETSCNTEVQFYPDGKFNTYYSDSEITLFPSKDVRTWEGFHRPFKDGDIVTWEDRGSLVACIYKERKNTASFNHYIALYKGGLGIVINGEIALTDDELSFATEEEKQKLFDAIKANGYKWNEETKTLDKLVNPKFKVGDKVQYKWATSCGSVYEVEKMRWVDNEIEYTLKRLWYWNDHQTATEEDLKPYKEETMEEKDEKSANHVFDTEIISFDIAQRDKYELDLQGKFHVVLREGKYYVERIKPRYPKTYEECCKVLGSDPSRIIVLSNRKDIIHEENKHCYEMYSLYQLLICRDAYWKVAGENMGLGKTWEPDLESEELYCVQNYNKQIIKSRANTAFNRILIFPTEEMRDAFYENFKELIESCKELL